MSKQKRSTTLTIRLDQNVLDTVRVEAERQGVSVNVLVNRQLRKYVDWGRFAERYGLVSLPKEGFRRMLRAIPDETLKQMGEEAGRQAPRDLILFIWGAVSFENTVKLLRVYSEYHGMGDLEEHEEDGKIRFVLHHDMGRKRSIYMEAYFKGMFESLFNHTLKTETTERSVAFTAAPSELRVAHSLP